MEDTHITTRKEVSFYLDMDGVLCDFDAQSRAYFPGMLATETARDYSSRTGRNAFWRVIRESKGEFWCTMPPLHPDPRALVERLQATYAVCILSSPDERDPCCVPGKQAWIEEHIGKDIPAIFSKEKLTYCQSARDILVDDLPANIQAWPGKGILFCGDWDAVLGQLTEKNTERNVLRDLEALGYEESTGGERNILRDLDALGFGE